MCKLALLPYLEPSKSPLAWQFARAITRPMCAADKDGFGYAAVSTDSRISVERWLTGANAWQFASRAMPDSLRAILSGIVEVPQAIRDTSGPMLRDKEITALLLHSRMATSATGLRNNHPHVSFRGEVIQTALVHNGVVQMDTKKLRYSTCDSETILTGYDKHGVGANPEAWQDAASDISGYYALGVAHSQRGKVVVDIIRDSSASLSVCWVDELNAPVIATSPEHVKLACKRLNWHAPIVSPFRMDTMARFDPMRRELVYSGQFKPNNWFASGGWQDYEHDRYKHWSGETGLSKIDEVSPHPRSVYLDSEAGSVQDVLAIINANSRGRK